MENTQKKHSYNATAAPSIGTDRLLRYLPKKQLEVAIDIPETGSSQVANQDVLNAVERGKLTLHNIINNKSNI